MNFKAVVFDLDGVICHTDEYHYRAWKTIADELDIPFDREINNHLRGVSRKESFAIVLRGYRGKALTEAEKEACISRKNSLYRSYLAEMDRAALSADARLALDGLREMGLRLAIGSSSKNAGFILEKLGLSNFFDAVVDGNSITHSKPDPEVFQKAAAALGISAADCLVVEDALSGVEAAKAAGMRCAAIGDAARFNGADYKLLRLCDLLAICRNDRTS